MVGEFAAFGELVGMDLDDSFDLAVGKELFAFVGFGQRLVF